jgi:hypothetical protein
MIHSDNAQQNAFQNPQQAASLHQLVQSLLQNQQAQQTAGIGQGGYGQGAFGQGNFGQGAFGGQFGQNWGAQNWGAQRQLSPQDVSNVLQQIAPILPQIVAQAQQQQYQQPLAAFGGGYGHNQRSLSQQDVSEVVRQILPIVPQLLQSMQQQNYGQTGGFGQQGFGQQGGGQGQAAYGLGQQHNSWQQHMQHQRQLSPQDVTEIVQQLTQVIPLAYGAQQRM